MDFKVWTVLSTDDILLLLYNCTTILYIGRSARSTTASVIQIPTTTPPPIIPKKNHETSTVSTVQPQQSVRYKSPTGPFSRVLVLFSF